MCAPTGLSVRFFVFVLCLLPAVADWAQLTQATRPSQQLSIKPTLEIQTLNKDFETWGDEIVINAPRVLLMRWGHPILDTTFEWRLYRDSGPGIDVASTSARRPMLSEGTRVARSDNRMRVREPLRKGQLEATPDTRNMQAFSLDLRDVLPATPGDDVYQYSVVVQPLGASRAMTNPVRITYQKNDSSTSFSFAGHNPEFQRPMRMKVNLSALDIIKADEECDEEPYLIPMVAYLDGTTISVLDLSNSRVRVAQPQRHNAHGNVSTDDDICSGRSLSIPRETGYFESTILPLNMELVGTSIPGCTPDANTDCVINFVDLTKATTVWLFVIAMEEDANDDDPVNVSRDAVVARVRAQLTECISGMSLADVADLIENGLDVEDTLTSEEEGIEFCGRVSGEGNSILAQIRKHLREIASDTARDEIMWQPLNLFHGGLLNILDDLADRDDYIGFGWKVFTYDQLMRARGHFPFELNFHKNDNSAITQPGPHPVTYRVRGSAARCEPQDGFCVTQTRPLSMNPEFQ